jgi:oligoendopeptidase F
MPDHSNWNHEEIFNLIPEVKEELQNLNFMNGNDLSNKMGDLLEANARKIAALDQSEELKKAREHDPQALLEVMKQYEDLQLQASRFTTWATVMKEHFAGQLANVSALTHEVVASSNHIQMQASMLASSLFMSMNDEELVKAYTAAPKLRNYEHSISSWRKMPASDPSRIPDPKMLLDAKEKLRTRRRPSIPEEEGKQAMSLAIWNTVKYHQRKSGAAGYKDTHDEFAKRNDVTFDLTKALPTFSNDDVTTVQQSILKMLPLLEKKLQSDPLSYSWETSKSIVTDAYARLDTELGKLAKRAFDEGWISARELFVANNVTFPGMPASRVSGAHPYAAVSFQENNPDSLINLAHEMAHVLSNHLAGEKQGPLTHFAPILIQENFAAVGEALLEKEMLHRANNKYEKAAIKSCFAFKELEIMSFSEMAKFENALYDLASKQETPPTYDELNALYGKHLAFGPEAAAEDKELLKANLWQIINQPPHNTALYPASKFMAGALMESFEHDPQRFRREYRKAMEAGATITAPQMWKNLLGKDVVVDEAFFERRKKALIEKFTSIEKDLSDKGKDPIPPPGRGGGGGYGGGGYSSYSSSSRTSVKEESTAAKESNLKKNWQSVVGGGLAVGAAAAIAMTGNKDEKEKDGSSKEPDSSKIFKWGAVALCAVLGVGSLIYAGRGGKSAMSEQQIKDGAKGILSFVLKGNSSGLSH